MLVAVCCLVEVCSMCLFLLCVKYCLVVMRFVVVCWLLFVRCCSLVVDGGPRCLFVVVWCSLLVFLCCCSLFVFVGCRCVSCVVRCWLIVVGVWLLFVGWLVVGCTLLLLVVVVLVVV